MHRGRMARRDMDFRGGAEKRDALEDVSTDMLQMKVRMKQMARAMDKHEEDTTEVLKRKMAKDGSKLMAGELRKLENKQIKTMSSRRRL